jgi:UDP-N-acetyl-D-mannosaminuronate dehydrogenase
VQTWSPRDCPISDFDLVVLLTDHAEFNDALIKGAARVLDCRNHFAPASNVERI